MINFPVNEMYYIETSLIQEPDCLRIRGYQSNFITSTTFRCLLKELTTGRRISLYGIVGDNRELLRSEIKTILLTKINEMKLHFNLLNIAADFEFEVLFPDEISEIADKVPTTNTQEYSLTRSIMVYYDLATPEHEEIVNGWNWAGRRLVIQQYNPFQDKWYQVDKCDLPNNVEIINNFPYTKRNYNKLFVFDLPGELYPSRNQWLKIDNNEYTVVIDSDDYSGHGLYFVNNVIDNKLYLSFENNGMVIYNTINDSIIVEPDFSFTYGFKFKDLIVAPTFVNGDYVEVLYDVIVNINTGTTQQLAINHIGDWQSTGTLVSWFEYTDDNIYGAYRTPYDYSVSIGNTSLNLIRYVDGVWLDMSLPYITTDFNLDCFGDTVVIVSFRYLDTATIEDPIQGMDGYISNDCGKTWELIFSCDVSEMPEIIIDDVNVYFTNNYGFSGDLEYLSNHIKYNRLTKVWSNFNMAYYGLNDPIFTSPTVIDNLIEIPMGVIIDVSGG